MKIVAVYTIKGREVEVVQCGSAPDLYYDLYADGRHHRLHLNSGEPWHDDGEGIPSKTEVEEALE